MKKIIYAYKILLSALQSRRRFLVTSVLIVSILSGTAGFISVRVNGLIFDGALTIIDTQSNVLIITPYIILFIVVTIVPAILNDVFIKTYAEPKTLLIFRTAIMEGLLFKLKRIKYEHLENKASMEIIDKTLTRIENSAIHLFPNYAFTSISSLIFSVGTLAIFASLRWWLVLTILIPFIIETVIKMKFSFNIYDEMESYWERDREYSKIGLMLRQREYINENRLNESSTFLINLFKKRMSARNKNYEGFFFRNLKKNLVQSSTVRLMQLGNAAILLWLYYSQGQLSLGLLLALILTLFSTLFSWNGLQGAMIIVQWGGFHANSFEHYKSFMELSERSFDDLNTITRETANIIEFDNVWFRYPESENDILKGLSAKIQSGEIVSFVGKNGEGKSTLVKLLLGLFVPNKGEIRINNLPLSSYSQEELSKIFGVVMQDFNKYNLSLNDNVTIGSLEHIGDINYIKEIVKSADVNLDLSISVGKEFDGGTELSGGQWQRVAIARAIIGNKPILILDEPTSQLDPMAESRLYSEFREISKNKTSILITHRLGSTAITDKIIVIENGIAAQQGTHDELMSIEGTYKEMYNAQKEWYQKEKA
ncbi:MAG: ABC transporter ATP-binding protein/permease [Oscillospiraceae bacterium]|nr:ABC transporter ATP-binding protein/permease [Oscillospiraceae bacterium]MCL2278914.1 ABC transporter ATP-binding protein/permease [Oscillospiraceae bacterium]